MRRLWVVQLISSSAHSSSIPLPFASLELPGRELATVLPLVLCFVLACHFYGVGVHLSVLLLVSLGPFLALILQAPAGLQRALMQTPGLVIGCYAALAMLSLHHLFISQSADTSFAPSIILASVPLWALVMATLKRADLVLCGVQWIVFALAAYSAIDYLVADTRAFAPLTDPNNYVTLLLMAWIPWLYQRLAQLPDVRSLALTAGITYVVGTALIATQSRFAVAMVLAFSGLFALLTFRQKLQFKQFGAAGAALLLAGLISWLADNNVPSVNLPGEAEAVVNSDRWLLIEGTWRGIKEFGQWNGFGVGGFALVYPQLRSLTEQNTLGNFTHNDYLQLAMEGGVWLTSIVVILVIVVAWALLRRALLNRVFEPSLGPLLAVAVALAHASVNFVVYILPLAVMLGLNLSAAWQGSSRVDNVRTQFSVRMLWTVTVASILSVGAHLALDSFSYAVFAGQNGVPGAQTIRQHPQKMFEYAQLAQKLNPRRGVPVLAEAQLRQRRLTANSPVAELFAIDDAYARALAVDPWNPSAYLAYHTFLVRFAEVLAADQEAQALIRDALRLDPTSVPVAFAAMEYFNRRGDSGSVEKVALNLLQWCEFMHRRKPGESADLLATMGKYAQVLPSAKLQETATQCTAKLTSISRPPRTLPWVLRLYLNPS